MNKQEFLEELTEIMQLNETIKLSAPLTDIEEWDSMAHLGVISFFDMEFCIELSIDKLKNIQTVDELLSLAGTLT